jgi:uncharacterized membrane protein
VRLRLSAELERLRASLFLLPMLAVFVALGLAALSIGFDRHIDQQSADLPLGLTSTVDSARAILSTVAAATISFAAIAFSVSLLIIQQASSQYSPRVVHELFRDPFNKRVMGMVVGTFTYCLVVLRSVRTALEKNGDPVIPNLSVAIAVILGIATILAIVAFINHSAHSMDVSRILDGVQHRAIDQIRREWSVTGTGALMARSGPEDDSPFEAAHTIRFDRSGWIQQLDRRALAEVVPAGSTLRVEAFPGRYAVEGTPIGALSVAPDDPEVLDRAVRAAVSTGDTRTMQQDVSFGLRQLADVALKALSPGINDPTTAQDAIFHSAAVLAELLHRDPPGLPGPDEVRGRVVLVQQPTHDDLVRLAFDETRRAAAPHPTVAIYLLEALRLLDESLFAAGLLDRRRALCEQADLVLAGAERADLLPDDLGSVAAAHAKRFGGGRSTRPRAMRSAMRSLES